MSRSSLIPKKLRKAGANQFENPDPLNRVGAVVNPNEPASSVVTAKTVVRQGVIETSNVNPAEEMTNLIKANRLFENNLKSVRAYDEMMRKEVAEVGKL